MGKDTLAALEPAGIAASSDPLPRRGEQALAVLRRLVPFNSAWLAQGRHMASLAVMSEVTVPPPPELRRDLGRLSPLVGRVVDPLYSPAAAARLAQRASAGCGGPCGRWDRPAARDEGPRAVQPADRRLGGARRGQPLPVVPVAIGRTPCAGRPRADHRPGLCQDPSVRIAIVSHPGDLHGRTARTLEVLGLIVEGCSNRQLARTLVISQRTVASHVEHVLAKRPAPTRTDTAVRTERAGWYVPPRAEEGRRR
jgi:DNA-binding CsgD family transcriptional regulator